MKIPVKPSRLVEGRSDERDTFAVINTIRDKMINQNVEVYPVALVTTDATLTSIWSDDLPPDSICEFWYTAIAQTSASGNIAGYVRRVVAKRVGTGAVAYVGAGADVIGTDKESVAGWDVAFGLDATSPGTLYATVTGAAATTITWRARIIGLVYPWS